MQDELIKFVGKINKNIYYSENFSVYALNVDLVKYPNVSINKYRNVSICGEMPELQIGEEYEIEATKENNKYGASYRVVNIKRNIPLTKEGIINFLKGILTDNQADALYNAYPNILELVKNNETDSIDCSKIHGVGDKSIQKIIDKIRENFYLSDLVNEFNGLISINMLKRIYRQYPSIEQIRDKIKKQPYKTLTDVSGIGFTKADAIVLALDSGGVTKFNEDIRTSYDRCLAYVIYALEENENDGHTYIDVGKLNDMCKKHVFECYGHFLDTLSDENVFYDSDNKIVALMKTFYKEQYIAQNILKNIDSGINWDCDIEKYRIVNDIKLTDEQINVIDMVCKNQVSILNGSAGSGKSSSTAALIQMLDDNDKTYRIFCPTGKSAKVIADFTKKEAVTIHMGLGCNRCGDWTFNKDNKLNADIVIVDESSMINVDLFYRLISALDLSYTKLLLIGDDAQLPSVGCGNVLHDLIYSNKIPTITLTKIFRYKDGGLMKVATDIRMGKTFNLKSMMGKTTLFGENKDYAFIDIDQTEIEKYVYKIYNKLLRTGESPEDIQVICCKNVGNYGTIAMNKLLQKLVNKNYGSEKCMHVGSTTYYDDDLVMQNANNYEAEIYGSKVLKDENGEKITAFIANGESGKIIDVLSSSVLINFGGIVVKYGRKDMANVSLGYAMTAHKSQGSSIKNVIVLSPKSDTFMMNSNLLYVALTRMKSKCFHIGSISTVNRAIKKQANMERNTFLPILLRNM